MQISILMTHQTYIGKAAILIFLALTFAGNTAIPQSNISEKWKKPGFFFGTGTGLAKTNIINRGIQTSSSPENNSDREFSLSGFVEAGYFFSEKFGILTRLSYHSTYGFYYNQEIYNNQYFTFDSENDPHELIVTGSDIGGNHEIEMLSVPLTIIKRFPVNEKIAFVIQPAIQLFFPLSSRFESGGYFTYKGYFPAYNVLLENLPEYGFATNLHSVTEGRSDLKPISFGANLAAGLDYLISKRLILVLTAYHDRSLTSISHFSSPDELVSTETAQLDGSIRGSHETKLKSTGVIFTVRYFLTDFRKYKYYFHPTPEQNLRGYERLHKKFRY